MTRSAWTNARLLLLGKTVATADEEGGELRLSFGEGWHLVAINRHTLSHGSLADLIGETLISFQERDWTELLTFGNGTTVAVDMRDGAFVGPEAMQLFGPADLTVIWN